MKAYLITMLVLFVATILLRLFTMAMSAYPRKNETSLGTDMAQLVLDVFCMVWTIVVLESMSNPYTMNFFYVK